MQIDLSTEERNVPLPELTENSPDSLDITTPLAYSRELPFEKEDTSEMSEEGSSRPKEEKGMTQQEMMISVATTVLDHVEKEKEKVKGAKVAPPDFFEGNRKDIRRFLTKVEIFLHMNLKDFNTNKKKCLFLLFYM
ncbi:hypothetical protein Moror_13126 [Moniliophthora roreri MCA 2997]|uniref:Reverse transcriptase-rnase h-integrase n=1 Tax=Moniliophthora roreri (strain MCA 2997) TaxID=1381753 RepID=V2X982_MONRO|nr:hypothetical protein Moror_13126 [Moniliophthora roreri MCA 2997]